MIVICDVNIMPHCHNIGFNQYILDHISMVAGLMGEKKESLCFVYNAESVNYLQVPLGVRVELVEVPMASRGRFIGNIGIWNLIEKRVRSLQPRTLFFLDLDQFQLAIGFSRLKCPISGIYCRPHHRIYPMGGGISGGLVSNLKRWKKRFVEQVMVSNKRVKKVFILNDFSGAQHLNQLFNTKIFAGLADPIFDYKYDTAQACKPDADLRLLLFGGLSERKNANNVIRAFGRADFKKKAILQIVGSTPAREYMNFLTELAQEVIVEQAGRKEILFKQGFVTNEEMEILHARANISVLVYRNFYFSSALMGRAAKHKMVIIAPDGGLMGSLTRHYGLGVTADPGNVQSIAVAMEKASELSGDFPLPGSDLYYKEHRPEIFLSTLFGS